MKSTDYVKTLAICRWASLSVPDVAFALAASRAHPRDHRPEIVLWAIAGAECHRNVAIEHALMRVLVFAQRRGIAVHDDVLAYAAIDGLERACRRKARVTLGERARQLGVTVNVFSHLRDAAERSIARAVREGLDRYLAACRGHRDAYSEGVVKIWSSDVPVIRKEFPERLRNVFATKRAA